MFEFIKKAHSDMQEALDSARAGETSGARSVDPAGDAVSAPDAEPAHDHDKTRFERPRMFASGDFSASAILSKLSRVFDGDGDDDALAGGGDPVSSARSGARDRLPEDLQTALDDVVTGRDWSEHDLIRAARAGNADVADALGHALADPAIDGNTAVRLAGVLRQMGTPAAATALADVIPTLADADVRTYAVKDLAEMGETGVQATLAMWSSAGPIDRVDLLPVLTSKAGLADPGARAAVIGLTTSDELEVSLEAANAIVKVAKTAGDDLREAAVAALADAALEHPVKDVRWDSALKLKDLIEHHPGGAGHLDVLHRLAVKGDANVVGALIDVYTDTDILRAQVSPEQRTKAFEALKSLKGRLEERGTTTERVMPAIGRIGSQEARAYLAELAKSPHASERLSATLGLGASGDPSAVATLLDLAKSDPNADVRQSALAGLEGAAQSGSATDRRATLQALEAALPGTTGALRAGLERSITALESRPDVPADVFERMVAAHQSGDGAALAGAMQDATLEDLKLFRSAIAGDGKSMADVLSSLRKSDPDGYANVLDAFTERASAMYEYGAVDPDTVLYQDLVAAEIANPATPDAVVSAYGARNLGGPEGAAAARILARTATDRSLGALFRGPGQWAEILIGRGELSRSPASFLDDEAPGDAIRVEGAPGVRISAEQLDRVASATMKASDDPIVRDQMAIVLTKLGTIEGRQFAAGHWVTSLEDQAATMRRELPAIEKGLAQHQERLAELQGMKALSQRNPDIYNDQQKSELDALIRAQISGIYKLSARHEALAKPIGDLLTRSVVQEALGELTPEAASDLLGRVTQGMEGTQAADALAGELLRAADDPEASPLFRQVFDASNKTIGGSASLLKVLTPSLVLRGEASFQRATQELLGLDNASKIADVENAIAGLKSSDPATQRAAREAIDRMGLGSGVRQLEGALLIANTALGLQEALKDPSVRNILSSGKDLAEIVELLGPHLTKFPRLAQAAKLAGPAATVAGVVVSALDLHASADRADLGGMIGDTLQVAGGLAIVGGLVADATVVGTVIGVPLKIVGTVLVVGGAIVTLVAGDSDEEKALKKWAEENLATY